MQRREYHYKDGSHKRTESQKKFAERCRTACDGKRAEQLAEEYYNDEHDGSE